LISQKEDMEQVDCSSDWVKRSKIKARQ